MGSSALEVVTKLHRLCECKENRHVIVNDNGCLPGLVLFLGNPDQEVQRIALNAIYLLCQTEENLETISNELGLLVSLERIIQKSESTTNDLHIVAEKIKALLEGSRGKESIDNADKNSRRAVGGLTSCADQSETAPQRESIAEFVAPSFFLNSSIKKSRPIVLWIKELEDHSLRDEVGECLLATAGVVSFTFEIDRCRVLVRLRHEVSVDDLFKSLGNSETSLHVSQIVKTPSGEEIALESAYNIDEENANDPHYLDDEFDAASLHNAVTSPSDIKGVAAQLFGNIGSFIRSWW